jgi:3-hydroxymyristoyl/3-hydroxydecanoyl-(acyl carrier protein) dehydratase
MSLRSDLEASCLRAGPGHEPGLLWAEFVLDRDLPLFAGHFPGHPLVPGVMQIEMIPVALEKISGHRYRVTGIKKAKFTSPVLPGERVLLHLHTENRGDDLRVRAQLRVGEKTAGSFAVDLIRL